MKYRVLRSGAVCLFTLHAARVAALTVPAGTQIEIRLKSKISTQTGKAKDPVEAVVIAPVMAGDQFAIPAGAAVRGTIEKTTQAGKADERSALVLSFAEIEINGAKTNLQAQLTAIDNARESIDNQGQITGILPSETITGELDSGLNKLASRYSGLADVLGAVKGAVLKPADTDITYDAGAELTLKLSAPLVLAAGGAGPAASIGPIPNEAGLEALVMREPFQTMAQRPSKPSDVTNIILIGTEDAVRKAFTDAGWSTAASLDAKAKFETFKALAESRGYSEAPVSVLLLDGRPPDIVFEKLNNTFAQRHHLRVWRRPSRFHDSPVWAIAATHDVGIDFSAEDRTFIHKIDSQIDRERAKVVNDLIFSGHVVGVELVDRPQVPQHGQNATGDSLDTDGRVAVLMLK